MKELSTLRWKPLLCMDLGKLLGHNIITVCAIIANRVNEKYSKNPKKPVKKLTELLLERLT